MHCGQRVICVAADMAPIDCWGNRQPQLGLVYTVRGFVVDRASGELGVLVKEIVNKPLPCEPTGYLGEHAWSIENFTPVIE